MEDVIAALAASLVLAFVVAGPRARRLPQAAPQPSEAKRTKK